MKRVWRAVGVLVLAMVAAGFRLQPGCFEEEHAACNNNSGLRVSIGARAFQALRPEHGWTMATGTIVPTETWYPERYSYKDGLRHGTRTLLTGFGINLFREFVVNW